MADMLNSTEKEKVKRVTLALFRVRWPEPIHVCQDLA
jgi:hypothetical protein